MAEYNAEPENRENPRLRVSWGNGPEIMADTCTNCGGVVVWNPKGLRWEHLQTWEVACSDEAIKVRMRTGLLIQSRARRN